MKGRQAPGKEKRETTTLTWNLTGREKSREVITLPPSHREPDVRAVLVWTMFPLQGPGPEGQVP